MSVPASVARFAPFPRPLTPLVGREREIGRITDLVRQPDARLVTLTGPGGVGKTRLAIAAAAGVEDDFRDGAAFVNLAPITNPNLVLDTIAGALGLRDMGIESLRDRLIDALAERNLLLVLDNFEQVVTAGPRVRDLLAACPGVTLLITSRISLRLSGEREFPVAPLPLSASTVIEEAGASGAVRLFVERVQAIRPEFSLTDETLPAVTSIVSRVDGLPLAIELAAARVRVLPPATLLQRLEQRLPLLTGGARDLPLRQQTMRDTIAWSYELLNDAEQALFRRLSVFVGGFTLEAAEAISAEVPESAIDASPGTPVDALDGITALIDHSLLRRSDGPGDEPRYQMLETVREYAHDCLEASREAEVMHRRHAAYFLASAEAADERPSSAPTTPAAADPTWAVRLRLCGPRLADWLSRLEADHDNLRAALDWVAHRGEPEALLRLARAIATFWFFRGPYEEGRSWLEQALAHDSNASPLLRRDALYVLGLMALAQDDVARAESCFGESLDLARTHGDPAGIPAGTIGLGAVAMQQGRLDLAAARLEEALAGAQRLDDPAMSSIIAGIAHSFLGALAYAQRALPLAAARSEAALNAQRALDDRWGIGLSLVRLGYATRDLGDTGRAMALLAEGLTVFARLGDPRIIAMGLDGVAGIAIAWEMPVRAARLLGAAAALREASGLPIDPAIRATNSRDVAGVRATLGEDTFAAEWNAGAALPLPEAIAEATAMAALAPGTDPVAPPANQADQIGLTPRETDVLRLLVQGLSDREIADSLFLSPRTVGWHVTHLLAKLDVPSRTAATAVAIRRGLV